MNGPEWTPLERLAMHQVLRRIAFGRHRRQGLMDHIERVAKKRKEEKAPPSSAPGADHGPVSDRHVPDPDKS